MNERLNKHLLDALHAIEAALGFVAGLDAARYAQSLLIRSAVERQLMVLGEAARRAIDESPLLRDEWPDLVFAVALRNRLVHGYDVIDNRIVFDTVQHDLPLLADQLRAHLQKNADGP